MSDTNESSDPRERMRIRILAEVDESTFELDEPAFLHIFNEDEVERLEVIKLFVKPPPDSVDNVVRAPVRWAQYQTTLFSSERLPVSNVICPLPPLRRSSTPPPDPDPATDSNSTFNTDRKALWAKLIASAAPEPPAPKPKALPPWRRHDAFDYSPRYPPGYIPPPPPRRGPPRSHVHRPARRAQSPVGQVDAVLVDLTPPVDQSGPNTVPAIVRKRSPSPVEDEDMDLSD